MRSFIFVFIGVIETDFDGNIGILKSRLEAVLAGNTQPIQFDLKEKILILTLRNPDFHIYLSFSKNDHETFEDWKQLARDFELPWDIKPVGKSRPENIYDRLEREGWSEYKPIHQLGFTILKEMENFKNVKVFTIPSIDKSAIWNRLF